jgi:hypothetical protein
MILRLIQAPASKVVHVARFGHGGTELICAHLQGIFPEKEPVSVQDSIFDAFNVCELNETVSKRCSSRWVSGDVQILDVGVDSLAAFSKDKFDNLAKLRYLDLGHNRHVLDVNAASFAPVQQRLGMGAR